MTFNPSDACKYHEGELEIDRDSDAWYDWDESCNGTIDHRLVEDHPEEFVWNFCDEDGTAPGCQASRHRQ